MIASPRVFTSEAEWREEMRQELHRMGWVEWEERHLQVEHLLYHQSTTIPQGFGGPLIIWEHPAGRCDCNIPEPE